MRYVSGVGLDRRISDRRRITVSDALRSKLLYCGM